jgi:hypothetical protein
MTNEKIEEISPLVGKISKLLNENNKIVYVQSPNVLDGDFNRICNRNRRRIT